MASGYIPISDAIINVIDAYNGNIKFNNGLMIEWGRHTYAGGISANGTATSTITFDIAFASTVYYAITNLHTSYPHTRSVAITSQSTSSLDIAIGNSAATAVTASLNIYWLCIGFWK